MDSVAQRTDLESWIDESLDYLTGEWEDIPEIACAWESWDEYDRLDFVLEWPLREDRLHQLQRWRNDGHFSSAQIEWFNQVEALIERHRPTLERLLED